ncbi:MAG: hypothetical protein A3G93_03750 [Nitrospinae bacterium RIFCSPLOWO2_12_FULL_45_22]|nr:MAG: hypothetical protein A3G93_03750 [Nitrospinae bacterium RIFCSPLOWO2_12_FULL_45_22]
MWLCSLFFLIYLMTVSPQIFWRDSSEFVATAYTLSISHPPGSPTYNLLAKIPTFLPWGSIAFRINLFSSLCAVFTLFFLFKTLQLLFGQLGSDRTDRPLYPYGHLIAAGTVMLFGFSFAFWRWSLTAEVYNLQELFIILMIYLALLYKFKPGVRDFRIILVISLLFSLSLGVHMTNAMFLPAFALLFAMLDRKNLAPKRLFQLAFCGLMGFSVYLYLPMRYVAGAPLQLGHTSNWHYFWQHITASRVMQGDKGVVAQMSSSIQLLPQQCWRYLGFLQGELSILGILLGIIGLIYLFRKDVLVGGLTLLIFMGNWLFFIRFWDASFGFIPTFLIYSIWIGLGAWGLLSLAGGYRESMRWRGLKIGAMGSIVGLALLVQAGQNLLNNYSLNNLTGFYTLYAYGKNLLSSLEYTTCLITSKSVPHFPIWYFQTVENRRRDVLTVHLMEFSTIDILEKQLINGWDRFNFYWVGGRKTELFYQRLIPNGLVFKFNGLKQGVEIEEADFKQHLGYRIRWEEDIKDNRYLADYESYSELSRINNEIYLYYYRRKNLDLAFKEFNELIMVNPNSTVLNIFYGRLLAERKEFEKATYYLQKSFYSHQDIYQGKDFDPVEKDIIFGLGVIMLDRGSPKDAIKTFSEYIRLDPLSPTGHYQLAIAFLRNGQPREALKAINTALALKPGDKTLEYTKQYAETMLKKQDTLQVP